DPQLLLRNTLEHLEHLLPGQGPILDFVHHNTIHGFQHLPFFEALAAYEKLTGIAGFQSEAANREHYRRGRISDRDLEAVLTEDEALAAGEVLLRLGRYELRNADLYRVLLLHELP